MHIIGIELENIKSHARSSYRFERGTTAITGENGAGKTTIIEAIAWVLFDLLEYKKEDFLRRGTKKGHASVTIESGLDEREYVVTRDTGTGYYVTDPRLQRRIADKKEEVTRFLWQHLGLEPGTDLRSLFRQAIGVPQGTFTAIFLEGATERKTAFDKLLKVEEYRQAAEKLRETSRHVEIQITDIRESVARAEGELSRSETVEAEHAEVAEQAAKLTAEIEALNVDLAALQNRVKNLDEQERRVSGLNSAVERSRNDKEKAELLLAQAEQALKKANEAAAMIETVRADNERHLAARGRAKDLERQRAERDRFRAESSRIAMAVANVRADQKRLSDDLTKIQDARGAITGLRQSAEEQTAIEKEITELRELVTNARNADERIRSIERELERMREKYRKNQEKMREAEAVAASAATLSALEKRDAEIVTEVANLQAGLERDRKFQSEIKNGFCPVLSQKCLNLKEGETLEGFLSSQFDELTGRITLLETERRGVAGNLAKAREGQQLLVALETFRQRETELADEGKELKAKKATLDQQRQQLGESEQRIAQLDARLKALADPAARIRVLEKEIEREPDVRSGLGDVETNLERLESERKQTDEQLDEFKDLDESWARLSAERDETAEAHRLFIANEAEAGALKKRTTDADTARSALTAASSAVEAAERELAAAGVDYDAELHKAERNALIDVERRAAEMRATHEATKRRADQLTAEITRFTELRKSLGVEFREKEKLEKVAEATTFIRDTLKEAAPRVARNYVYHVSLEANVLFREITGNAERSLEWGEDYAIMLEEDGHRRPFVSLSGGEQMAAALSVRLALLKQLTDIRIAFFDEPTANMDAERRENLAMQVSRITNFDQLFVISHDETFDNFVDNVIAL
ncbi:MAG: SMC family ATPase [Pyrinomonadaceae bacterium]|nr:SMC family ATPase [Pyrinomonadaceae bacterium]